MGPLLRCRGADQSRQRGPRLRSPGRRQGHLSPVAGGHRRPGPGHPDRSADLCVGPRRGRRSIKARGHGGQDRPHAAQRRFGAGQRLRRRQPGSRITGSIPVARQGRRASFSSSHRRRGRAGSGRPSGLRPALHGQSVDRRSREARRRHPGGRTGHPRSRPGHGPGFLQAHQPRSRRHGPYPPWVLRLV